MTDMDKAKRRAELGISRSAEAADRAQSGWCDAAVIFLMAFAKQADKPFLIEEARGKIGELLPAPTDARAWGVVTRQAVRAEFIERVPKMFLPAASSNGALKAAYRRGRLA